MMKTVLVNCSLLEDVCRYFDYCMIAEKLCDDFEAIEKQDPSQENRECLILAHMRYATATGCLGDYRTAAAMAEEVYDNALRLLGEEHPRTLTALMAEEIREYIENVKKGSEKK